MSTNTEEHHEHFILSKKTALTIWIALMVLTIITVAIAQVDLGKFNFTVAMIVATVKASLVVFYFMGMKADSNENRLIFFSGFLFVAIFIFFTFADILFRDPKSIKRDPQSIKNESVVTEKTTK